VIDGIVLYLLQHDLSRISYVMRRKLCVFYLPVMVRESQIACFSLHITETQSDCAIPKVLFKYKKEQLMKKGVF
jgi:hypothetical protein